MTRGYSLRAWLQQKHKQRWLKPPVPMVTNGPDMEALSSAAPAMPADTPPALLQSYALVKPLGSGGESDVWLAQDRLLQRRVVVKRMTFTCELEQLRRDTALHVIAAAAPQGAPQIYAAYKSMQVLWLVLEHIPGTTLADFRPHTAEGGLGIGQIVCIAMDVMQALDELHNAGWIHGDISPANVVVDVSGRARLIDFGQAGHVGDDSRGRGVPGFSRPADVPDQVMTTHDDTYALGALLFWLLCGQTPTQIRDAHGQTTTIAPWLDDMSSPTHELLWATAQALIEPNHQRRPPLVQLVQSLHRDERKLPHGSRANLGRLAGRSNRKSVLAAGRARSLDGNPRSSTGHFSLAWPTQKGGQSRWHKPLVMGLLLVAASLWSWQQTTAVAHTYTLTTTVADVSPATVLAIPLDADWVSQVFREGVGAHWQHLAQGAERVGVSVACAEQLCQLTLRHSRQASTHSHQNLVLSAASGEVWTAAIERLAQDFAQCEANR